MKAIQKYRLETSQTDFNLDLKKGFRIVHSEFCHLQKAVLIWVEQSLAVDTPSERVSFKLVQSDVPLPERFQHICSAFDAYAPRAFHLFAEQAEALQLSLPLQSRRPPFAA